MSSNPIEQYIQATPNVSAFDLYVKFPNQFPNMPAAQQALKERVAVAGTANAVTVIEPQKFQKSEGEIPTDFENRACPLIARGVPVIPLRPKTKIAFIKTWENVASVDPEQIKTWAKEHRDANVASVAKAQPGGVWFFDADRAGLVSKIESETGQKIPSTFMVRSRPGAGHYYFRQNAASIAMGNRQKSDKQGELFSCRVDDRYVVGPLSVHPDTNRLYEVINDAPIVEAPQWLIDWCVQQT